jgi:hypothetical protein
MALGRFNPNLDPGAWLCRGSHVSPGLARQLFRRAAPIGISFGLTYNYVDDDIAHSIGRLRYMQLIAEQQDTPPHLAG